MQVKTGSYTGNGTDNRTVTGVGFQPDVLIVKRKDGTNNAYFRQSGMASGYSMTLRADSGLETSKIKSLDTDGFTLGTTDEVNGNTYTYTYIALRDNGANDFAFGTYTGNGTDNRNIQLQSVFAFNWLVIKGDGLKTGTYRPKTLSGDASLMFYYTGTRSDAIQSMSTTDGTVQLGTNDYVNNNGRTYYWFGFKEVTNFSKNFTYTGDGTDNRDISAGFQPGFVWLKQEDDADPRIRTAGHSGDASQSFDAAQEANSIQSFISTGFNIGSNSQVNLSAKTYHVLAIKEGTSSVSATATPSVIGSAMSSFALVLAGAAVAAATLLASSGTLFTPTAQGSANTTIADVKGLNFSGSSYVRNTNNIVDANNSDGVSFVMRANIRSANGQTLSYFLNSPTNDALRINIENTRKLFIWIIDSSGTGHLGIKPNNLVTLNQFSIIGFTYKKLTSTTSQVAVYLNGTQIGTATLSYVVKTTAGVQLGLPSSLTDMIVDWIKFYPKELTSTEFATFTPSQSAGPTGAVVDWHFDDLVGSSTTDSSGNGYAGIVTSATLQTIALPNEATSTLYNSTAQIVTIAQPSIIADSFSLYSPVASASSQASPSVVSGLFTIYSPNETIANTATPLLISDSFALYSPAATGTISTTAHPSILSGTFSEAGSVSVDESVTPNIQTGRLTLYSATPGAINQAVPSVVNGNFGLQTATHTLSAIVRPVTLTGSFTELGNTVTVDKTVIPYTKDATFSVPQISAGLIGSAQGTFRLYGTVINVDGAVKPVRQENVFTLYDATFVNGVIPVPVDAVAFTSPLNCSLSLYSVKKHSPWRPVAGNSAAWRPLLKPTTNWKLINR